MKRWLPVAGAGLVGLVLAVVVFQMPDTGETVDTQAAPTVERKDDPLDFKDDQTGNAHMVGNAHVRNGATPAPPKNPEDYNGPNPLALERKARMQEPDATFYGKAASPWTVVTRQLNVIYKGDDDAKELATRVSKLAAELRAARRTPDEADFDALESQQRDLMDKIQSSEFGSEPTIKKSIERIDALFTAYHTPQE